MENTIFFGNGINRLRESNPSWANILDGIKATPFNSEHLPNTMTFERVVLDRCDYCSNLSDNESKIKEKLAEQLMNMEPSEVYETLYTLPAAHYLTTNYDNAFVDCISKHHTIEKKDLSTEDIYSVRRRTEIKDESNCIVKLWQIHGSIAKPKSIMLGLDHYCGYIGKIDSYIKGTYAYGSHKNKVSEVSMEEKLCDGRFTGSSWVELFFSTNIHIVGFSFDFAETDIWWILNRRARMMKDFNLKGRINNRIYFYCSEIHEQTAALLKSFDVEVDIIPIYKYGHYEQHYADVLSRIKERS